jgi:hypothetical protein
MGPALLLKQMVWDWIEAVFKFGVDVRIIFVSLATWIVCDVEELISKVVCVSYAMVVVSGVPDLSCRVFAGGKGVSAFDVLDAFCC